MFMTLGEFSSPADNFSIPELEAYLRTPENSLKQTENVAWSLCYSLKRALWDNGERSSHFSPRALDRQSFDSFYDPTLPTIVVDNHNTFSGTDLIGYAEATSPDAQRLLNIFFVSAAAGSVKYTEGSQEDGMLLTSGAIILPDNTIHYGVLPFPVRVDMYCTTDPEVIAECEAENHPSLMASASIQAFDDKKLLPQIIQSDYVQLPQRFNREDIAHGLSAPLAIKPAKGSMGRGVALYDKHDTRQALLTYDYLDRKGYEPLIEQRVKSWPFIDPDTGERLDWNVRAITGYGELIGMYIRANRWGQPINKSLGAKPIHMNDLEKYITNPEERLYVRSTLIAAGQVIAAEPAVGLSGIDLTVDESGKPFLYEVNIGNFGGITTMARLEKPLQSKLALAERLRQLLSKHISVRPNAHPVKDASKTLLVSFGELVLSTMDICEPKQLLRLPKENIPLDTSDQLGVFQWALNTHKTSGVIAQPSLRRYVEDLLADRYPLEIRDYLPSVLPNASDIQIFQPLISEASEAYPQDHEWSIAKAVIAVINLDFPHMKEIFDALKLQGANANPFTDAAKFIFLRNFTPLLADVERIDSTKHRHLFSVISDIPLVYCTGSYESVDNVLQEYIQNETMKEGIVLLQNVRLFTQIATQQWEDAIKTLTTLQEHYDDDFAFDFIFNQDTPLLTSPEGMKFLFRGGILYDYVLQHTLRAIEQGREYISDNRQGFISLMHTIANEMPVEGPEEHREWLAQMLTQLIEQPDNTSLLYPKVEQSDITKLGTLIWKLEHKDSSGAYELIEDFRRRGILESDMGYLIEEFSHLVKSEQASNS